MTNNNTPDNHTDNAPEDKPLAGRTFVTRKFRVTGAGSIRISADTDYQCRQDTGFDFGVEWGCFGYTGGVLLAGEALRLAIHILDALGLDVKQFENAEIKPQVPHIQASHAERGLQQPDCPVA